MLIGPDRLKATALGFHLSQAATASGSEELQKYIWTQSLYRACLGFRLAETVDRTVSGEAFVVGLLLDAGVPLLPGLAGKDAEEIVNRHSDPSSQYAEEFNTLGFTHVDVVTVLCKIWALPEMLVNPISKHHRKPKANWRESREGILHAISFFAGSLILNKEAASMYTPPLRTMASAYFDLAGVDLTTILAKARDDFNATKDMFAEVTDKTVSAEAILESANTHLGLEHEVKEISEDDIRSIKAGDFSLEILPHRADLVTIYLTDESGARIGSEQINPQSISPGESRERFLLDELNDSDIQNAINEVISIAA